jgi:hypothetical protein
VIVIAPCPVCHHMPCDCPDPDTPTQRMSGNGDAKCQHGISTNERCSLCEAGEPETPPAPFPPVPPSD